MKKTIIITGLSILLMSCSSTSGNKSTDTTDNQSSATQSTEAIAPPSPAETLMAGSDCMSCHKSDMKLVGPSFKEIANKYTADSATINKLTQKILVGGTGVWGTSQMTAHPALKEADAKEMVRYILTVK